MKEPTSVGLGEIAVSRDPDDVLVAYGLGSCLGISMIDPVSRSCGLLHAVLPEPVSSAGYLDSNPAKYVDKGIASLIDALVKVGANRSRLVTRVAGGANMMMSSGMTKAFDIGTRNIVTAHAIFSQLKMAITAEEVGGHTGRTVRVYVASGRVTVKVIGNKEHDL